MKIVINKCFGGFSLSPEAVLWLYKKKFDMPGFKTKVSEYFGDDESSIMGKKTAVRRWKEYQSLKRKGKRDALFVHTFTPDMKYVLSERFGYEYRNHPLLVKCVETIGEKANGACAQLAVVEIPDGVKWEIDEYDGLESIEEVHRSWG